MKLTTTQFAVITIIVIFVIIMFIMFIKTLPMFTDNYINPPEEIAKLVIVHIGGNCPDYLPDFIQQVNFSSPQTPIYVCVESSLVDNQIIKNISNAPNFNVNIIDISTIPKSDLHKSFETTNTYANNFLQLCSGRFAVLYDFVLWTGFKNVFHMEYDNLLYTNLQNLYDKMKNMPEYSRSAGIYDSLDIAVPSFMFFKDSSVLEDFVNFMIANKFKDDMVLLGKYIQIPGKMGTLPVITYEYAKKLQLEKYTYLYKNSDILGMVFDGRAVGQYIGGTHEDDPGFINQDTLFKVNEIGVIFEQNKNPTVCGIPIANLHVHSKKLSLYKRV